MKNVEALVIGAGQAGLASAYHLQRRGVDFAVLDGNDGPGGAWRHRWPTLTLGRAHRIADLPGSRLGDPDPGAPAADVVSEYFAEYEQRHSLPVLRPVRVRSVTSYAGPDGPLDVMTDGGVWRTMALVNATGTWNSPYWPSYPGRELFRGRQLHTHDYRGPDELAGKHVLVVGGGTSAVQHLLEIARVATTTWVTRRPVSFTDRPFDVEWGREVERLVDARVRAGLPPASVVSATGLPATPAYRDGIRGGVLVPRPMFAAITENGVRFPDGSEMEVDVLLWATGFRASLGHLAPLRLREPGGGVRMDGPTVVRDPRVQLVGYGPSASTLGATRAGRVAALRVAEQVRSRVPARAA